MQPVPSRLTPAKDDLTNQLLTEFKSLIAHRVLRAGARLPPERELATRFGVSRSSLRHVLKVLEIMGVLTQRVGDGTYLATSAAGILSQPLEFLVLLDDISLSDLLETRLIVEPELAARAAERATSEDLAALRATLDGMKKERDHKKRIDFDLAFHEAISRASSNLLCQRLFALVHRSMMTSILLTSQLVDWDHTLSFHRPIYQAIDRRDAEEARRRMTVHLLDAKKLLFRVGSEAETADLHDGIRPITGNARQKAAKTALIPQVSTAVQQA